MFMMATDFTAIFLAMPPMAADLTPSSTQSLWIVHIGELIAAGTVITMGWLTGRIGPRALLLLALPLYALASALAAFAQDPETLLVARVLIGLATAAAGPATFATFAVVMGAFPVGAALGPPLTGLLLEHFWWGSVFLINAPVAALAALGGLWLFPCITERTTERLDVTSVVVSMTAVMLAVFGLQEIAERGFSLSYAVVVLTAGVLGAWFVRRQRRLANPLLDLDLFAAPLLRLLTVFFILVHVAFVAADFVLIQYLQVVLGLPAGTLGLVLALPGMAAITSTAITPTLISRLAPVTVMSWGTAGGLLGAGLIVLALTRAPGAAAFAAGMTIMSFAMSPAMVLATQLIVTSVPRRQAGPAASIQEIGASLGSAIGIMALGSLASAVFGRGVSAGAPEGVSGPGLEMATQSLGAAVAFAEELGGDSGERLLSVVHEAWAQGTLAAMTLAIVVGVVMLVMIARGLRWVQIPVDEKPDPDVPDEFGVPAEPSVRALTKDRSRAVFGSANSRERASSCRRP